MAAPVIASETADAGFGDPIVLAAPTGMAEGDTDIIYFRGLATVTTLTGYTLVHADADIRVYWRIAPASPGDATIDLDGSTFYCARRLRITGAHASAPIDSENSGASNVDDPSCPSVTTTVDDCLVLLGLGDYFGDADGYTEPTSTTVQGTHQDSGSTTLALAYFTQASAGATGAKQWTGTSANDSFNVSTIAIAPAAGGAPAAPNVGSLMSMGIGR